MKKLLVAMFVALLMVGCGGEEIIKNGPYTEYHENGQKAEEGYYKDGEKDGLTTHWYENGQKKVEVNFKDGNLVTAVTWKPNGDKCPVT